MKICAKCNLEYDDKFTFCQKCGNRLKFKEERKICSNCGKEFETDGEFCPFCGGIIKCGRDDSVIVPSHETTVKPHEKNKINEIKVSSTQEKQIQISNDTNRIKPDKKLSVLITIIVILSVLATSLGFDNVGNFISANQADLFYITDSIKLGNLRRDLFDPPESMTEEEYNLYSEKLSKDSKSAIGHSIGFGVNSAVAGSLGRAEYKNIHEDRILMESDYKLAHQKLVNNKSSLQRFDNLTSYMFNTRKAALKLEESVLIRGGTWTEAQEAYDTMMNGK